MVDLLEAYDGVVTSSTDIIKNKQRHLYHNMFDLLQTTTRAASVTSNITISDDICQFWYSEILPICFDDDIRIQNSAIDSLDIFINNIDSVQFRNSPKWPQLKQQIIDNYIDKLNKMRNDSNCNWYKIWCLFIRILNQEIIRSASIINTFLSVVEQGFRSSNYDIRAEAFLCWKVLIEIFAKYNELISPKRIKLISIPLRSSHAKTSSAAINKFKVWWYFLLKLNDSIYNNCEMTFEPFLQFCFGSYKSGNNYNMNGQLEQFKDAKAMAVITLIDLLGSSHKEIQLLFEKYELECTEQTLITESIMQKSYKYIMKACFEATIIIIEEFTNRTKLIELLWRNLISQVIQTKNVDVYKECCNIIKELIQNDYDNLNLNIKPNIIQICELFGTHYAFLLTTFNNRESTFELLKISETIIDFTDILLSSNNLYFSSDIYIPIIKNIYDIDEYKESPKYWDMLKVLVENLLKTDQIDNFKNFEIKFEIWKKLSLPIITYLDVKVFEFRLAYKAELINKWLLWPMNKIVLTKLSLNCIKNDLKLFNDDFFIIWKKLMDSCANAEGRHNFQIGLYDIFVIFTENHKRIPKFQEILGSYINCCENKFDLKSAPKDQLDLVKKFLTKQPEKNKNYNKIIEYLNEYFASLNELKIVLIYNNIVSLTKVIIQGEQLNYITKSCLDNYKKNLIEKLKFDKIDKKYLREFKSLFKNDEFVTIPKVWSLNPDKLTDHQIEKMKEKNCDIPALYNDINSHSEDSHSIKPWTPNKIVINKNKDTEEIITPGNSEIIINSPRQSKKSTSIESVVDDLKQLKPIDSIIQAYCEISDTNDSSTTISDKSIPIVEKNIKNNNYINKKKLPKKKINTTTALKKPTKKEEQLLKKMNIQIDDEKKKNSLLRKLSIDTIEGNKFLQTRRKSYLHDNDTGVVTRKSEKEKSRNRNSIGFGNNLSKSKKIIKPASRKSLNFKNNNNQDALDFDFDDQLLPTQSSSILNNSDDDIVVSLQNSESILSRRRRKSGSTLSNTNHASKTTEISDPTETSDNLNKSLDSVIEKVPTKNTNENNVTKTCEVETQINIENFSTTDSNSSKTSITNNFENTEKQTIQNIMNEKKTQLSHSSDETLLSNSSYTNYGIETRKNLTKAHELFLGITKEVNSDYLIDKSPLSESVKELEDYLNVHINPNKINVQMENERKQQNDDSSWISEQSNSSNQVKPAKEKKPSALHKSQKKDFKEMSELETEPNTIELIYNSLSDKKKQCNDEEEMSSTPKHRKINLNIIEDVIKSPTYSPIKAINKSTKLLDKGIKTIVTLPECDSVDKKNDTPIKPVNISKLFDGVNNNIATSPECENVDKRNAEFLNDTLNISPIHITPYKCNAEKDISNEEMEIGEEFVKTRDFTELIEKQQLSPIKKVIKPATALSSPPDRKSTSNSSSPGPKPKQLTSNLTGRGAQFINMIRNRKIISPGKRFLSARNDDSKNISEFPNTGNKVQHQQENIPSTPTRDNDFGLVVFTGSTAPETPQQLPRDLLVFSKVLPSPFASPSASILKRKCGNDSIDDFDSPAVKRKRVSFHDPPVSVTKEYVKNDDEDSSKVCVKIALNKFLQSSTPQPNQKNINTNQQQHQQAQATSKHILKRKSRADSMIELLRFNESPNLNPQKKPYLSKSLIATSDIKSRLSEMAEINNYDQTKELSNIQQHTSNEIDTIKWNTTEIYNKKTSLPPLNKITESTSEISSVQQIQEDYEPSLTPSPQIYFPDESAIFKHIFDKYTIDDIFQKYCENGYDLNSKNVHNIIKEISTKMDKDTKIKTNVLEMLSEKHPKEFLDHALQENLSSVVCDRLNSSSVIEFVFEKSKINTGVRKIVFEKMESIVSVDRLTRDRHDFFMKMLRNTKLTNDEILECIDIISAKRIRNNGRGDETVVSASETVDSSSAL